MPTKEAGSVVTHAQGKKDVPVDQLMQHISSAFPYKSHYATIKGSKMRYIDEGEGDPILFLHGNPTSVYLWRNIMPYMEGMGRIVAFDMIGMGESDKLDIDYSMEVLSEYAEAMIEHLDLKNVTLVLHDWGGAIGLHYARRHEDNVKGVAFMEANVPPYMPIKDFESMGPETGAQFEMIHSEEGGRRMLEENFFIESNFRGKVVRDLTDEDMKVWRNYYPTAKSRLSALGMARGTPIGGKPEFAYNAIDAYGKWMQETELPLLLCWCKPGIIIGPEAAEWLADHCQNLESHYLGIGLHYVQEDHPDGIGYAVKDWMRRNNLAKVPA